MGVKTDNGELETKYTFHRKGGRSIIERRPVFSPDGESVLIIVDNIIRVYNIHTGDCVRILEPETGNTNIVSVHFPENEQHNLYGCSEKGCVTIWTWEQGAVLREKDLQIPDNLKILTFDLLDNNECFITACSHSKKLQFCTYSIKTGQLLYQYAETTIQYINIICVAVGWCAGNDRFAAICNGTEHLYIQNLTQPHIKAKILNQNGIRILGVTVNTQEGCVAITDALGRATILRGNLFMPKVLGREVMHWHSLPLITATFSQQGSYLLTGGLESVLVKWSVGALASRANEKQFIPRLPGSIRYISTSMTNIAITLTNNTVVIASAQMRVTATILECGGLSPVARVLGSSLMLHRPLGALLLGGRTGHLQLYSTTTDKVLYNIDITQQNKIPPSRSNLLPLDTEVTCAAVSANGRSLVTSEYRNDGLMYSEERLKFWLSTTNNASPFTLNTCVNLSHGGCNVICLTLDNAGNICVSAGSDQKFRIWKKDTTTESNKKRISWSCLTACYYSSGIGKSLAHDMLNKFKTSDFQISQSNCYPYMVTYNKKNDIVQNLINVNKNECIIDANTVNTGLKKDSDYDMGGVAISQDGSLIAAWFGCKLTLWDTHLCNLRTTLSHIALRPKGMDVRFGNKDAAHYVVCTTSQRLAVWSLLSLTVKWMVKLQPSCLTSDPFSNKMAIVTTTNDVFVFTPHSSTPILSKKNLLDPKSGVLKYCTFGAPRGEDVRLYMMRNDSEIYCLEPEDSDRAPLEAISRRILPKSNFSVLLAEQQLTGVQAPVTSSQIISNIDGLGKSAISQLFSAAPHMMPPVSLLCSSFLEHLSGRQDTEVVQEEDEVNMEVDNSSSDEEEQMAVILNSYSPKAPELWTPNYEEVKEKRLKKIMKQPLLDIDLSDILFKTF